MYRCENWSLAMSDEYRGFINSVSRQTLERPNKEGIDGYSICHSWQRKEMHAEFLLGKAKGRRQPARPRHSHAVYLLV